MLQLRQLSSDELFSHYFDYLPKEIWLWKVPRLLHGVDVDALDVGPDLDGLVALVVGDPADCAVPVVEIYG